MASTTKARDKASTAVEGARPYVQRLIEDEELRDNLREAYDAGRNAYSRASGAKRPSALLTRCSSAQRRPSGCGATGSGRC